MVLLLLIHWLCVPSLFVGGGVFDGFLFCYAILSCLSLLQSSGRVRNSWLLYFNCLLASAVDCLWCFVSLYHAVVGWAAICNCGISWSYLLILQVHYT